MAIHFVTGKPGGGKTLYSVQLIVNELLNGNRAIITNVPLKLDMLNEYIQTLTDRDCRVVQRVRLLSDVEAAYFWTYRPRGRLGVIQCNPDVDTLDEVVGRPIAGRYFVGKEGWDRWQRPDYMIAKGDGGVLYVLDEVQNFFSARRWAQTGPDVLYYQSQHRKVGDTVVLITQAAQLVETQFRAIAEDFCEIKNWSKMRISYLTMPRVFLRQLRASCSPNALVLETKWKRLDMRLASCYDTAAGVGIHGTVADKGERAKGVPWWVALCALGIGGYFACKIAATLFVRQFTIPRMQTTGMQVVGKSVSQVSTQQPSVVQSVGAPVVRKPSGLRITGQFGVGQDLRLCLSDGRIVGMSDIGMLGCTGPGRWWYVVDGERLTFP